MTDESTFGALPEFPSLSWGDVNEWRIERAIERLVNRADRLYMSGEVSAPQYTEWHKALDAWADTQYAKTRFGKPISEG